MGRSIACYRGLSIYRLLQCFPRINHWLWRPLDRRQRQQVCVGDHGREARRIGRLFVQQLPGREEKHYPGDSGHSVRIQLLDPEPSRGSRRVRRPHYAYLLGQLRPLHADDRRYPAHDETSKAQPRQVSVFSASNDWTQRRHPLRQNVQRHGLYVGVWVGVVCHQRRGEGDVGHCVCCGARAGYSVPHLELPARGVHFLRLRLKPTSAETV